MNCELAIYQFIITKDSEALNRSLEYQIRSGITDKVIKTLNTLRDADKDLYNSVYSALDSVVLETIGKYEVLISADSLQELAYILDYPVTMSVDGITELLNLPVSNSIFNNVKYIAACLAFSKIPNLNDQIVDDYIDMAKVVLEYAKTNIVSEKLIRYRSDMHNLKANTTYSTYAVSSVLRQLRDYGELKELGNVLSILTQQLPNLPLLHNHYLVGINKVMLLDILSIPYQNISYFIQLYGNILATNFINVSYGTYVLDLDILATKMKTKLVTGFSAAHYHFNKRACAITALLSSTDLVEAAKIVSMYGKATYKCGFAMNAYQEDFNGIIQFADATRNKILNASFEDLSKLYPSRYFIQTMLMIKHIAGVLTDDDVQWCLTHKTNTNIQNGAMLFMEVMCGTTVTVTETVNKKGKLHKVVFSNEKYYPGATSKTILEQKYTLSYAMYGLYL